jgi:nucleoside-diphosphate-sugar epimerase
VIEKSANAPLKTIQTNALGTAHLLEALRIGRKEPSAIVIASTDKVYGEMEEDRYSEQSPLRGVGIYDAAKLAGDVFAQTYHQVFGLPTVVVRLCNLFGPHDYNVGFRLFPKALTALFATAEPSTPVLYFNSLNHYRDYLFIDDAVRAFLLVASTPTCEGDVFNISAAHHASTPDIMRLIVEHSADYEALFDKDRAKKIRAHGISVIMENGTSNVVAISRQHLDGSKLAAFTGFVPEVRFAEGLQKTIEFYRSHYERGRVFASV